MKTIKLNVFRLILSVVLCTTFGIVKAQVLPTQINVQIPGPRVEDGMVTLNLTKYSVRDPNHCRYYVDEQSYSAGEAGHPRGSNPNNFREITLNNTNFPVRTYRGSILEEPNSQVIAVIWPGNTSMSVFVQEGIRYLWQVEDLPINLNLSNGQATINLGAGQVAHDFSKINRKSQDWVPTINNAPYPPPGNGSGPVVNGGSPHGWKMIPSGGGMMKMQVAYDVEPEWFAERADNNDRRAFAILEHATNALDVQFARDLGVQYRMTGVVRRADTDLHQAPADTKTTWRSNGLGDNPGSTGVRPNSIPFQHLVFTGVNEGNPVAFESRKHLTGGNFTRVPVKTDDNSGLNHEVSHTWGGRHFVYPRDIMSGGGSWFGPTTNQAHIYNKNSANITGGLPIASNAQYGWNVHPYATPDLVNITPNTTVSIGVLLNDFDTNGDPVKISTFDAVTPKGGNVTLNNGALIYTPASNFKGRDQFNYTISDGSLFNTTWVQVDVNDGGLLMRYDFEQAGNIVEDKTTANLDGESINFDGTITQGKIGNGWVFPKLPTADNDNDDSGRAFISFGDVIDPFSISHTVSIWFNLDAYSVNDGGGNCHIISNSSTAINKLISGYNIFMEKSTKQITFEIAEQLSPNAPSDIGEVKTITGPSLSANQWYHIALVIDRGSNKAKGYLNGVSIGQVSLEPESIIKGKPEGDRFTSGALGICTYKPKKYTPFVGVMDEFKAFGKALTDQEVLDEYNNTGTDPGGDLFSLENVLSGNLLATDGQNSGDNLTMVSPTTAGNTIEWKSIDQGDGYFLFENQFSNMSFRPVNSHNYTAVTQQNTEGNWMRWRFVDAGNGNVWIQNKKTNMYLYDAAGVLKARTFTGNDKALWKIIDGGTNKEILIEDNESINRIVKLYPNPSDSNIDIQYKKFKTGDVFRVFDSKGREVISGNLKEILTSLDISGLQSGIYIVNIHTKNNDYYIRFIK
ncbi:Ig-like domain-containing protein [Aquimarina sp. 2201CG5-10]|uniref:Ig-like domain-containing protein n=1 Tax=Aquimarina callyspongiae TaxID=3098150 RepID=UPI002AB33BB1|nr:LamG-like jellyroll fold domain-containing protein [Aquimarina sp. 2201CG5-10]MDY8134171.1 LamG-like jellyroll fold domain-containing protein [Aquimarina sp. 2201CG5-10]